MSYISVNVEGHIESMAPQRFLQWFSTIPDANMSFWNWTNRQMTGTFVQALLHHLQETIGNMPSRPVAIDFSMNQMALTTEDTWRAILLSLTSEPLGQLRVIFGLDISLSTFQTTWDAMSYIQRSVLRRRVIIAGFNLDYDELLRKQIDISSDLKDILKRHENWNQNDDYGTELEITKAVEVVLKEALGESCVDTRPYYMLPGDKKDDGPRERFKVYGEDGNELTDFDGILIPVKSDGSHLGVIAIVESKHSIRATDIYNESAVPATGKLVAWLAFEAFLNTMRSNAQPSQMSSKSRLMWDFFQSKANCELWYFMGGKNWPPDQLRKAKKMGQRFGKDHWYVMRYSGNRFGVVPDDDPIFQNNSDLD
jgi:hypothetical protein